MEASGLWDQVADCFTVWKNEAVCTLYDMQQAQNNQYDDDNDQRMDPTAGLREA
jgi:hypothetical protein